MLSLRSCIDHAIAALAGVMVIATPGSSVAGTNTWTSIGPDGGEVYSVALDPSISSRIFAATAGGVFRSDDGGATWNDSSRGIGSVPVHTLVIDPAHPRVIIAHRLGRDGFFRSTDGGKTWLELKYPGFVAMAALSYSTSPFTLHVGSESFVYSSTDHGETWTVSPHVAGRVLAVAVHPLYPGRLVAACDLDGVMASDDGGRSWRSCGEVAGLRPLRVAFDPHDPEVVFFWESRRLFRSHDGCRSWTYHSVPEFTSFSDLVGDPHRNGTFYAVHRDGLMRTTDWGDTWQSFGPNGEPLHPHDIVISGVDPSTMVIAAEAGAERRGVFVTKDSGATWTIGMTGMHIAAVESLVIHPTDRSTVFAGIRDSGLTSGGGVYASRDSGRTWTLMPGAEGAGPIVAMDPVSPEVLYAADADRGISKTTDSGATWSQVWPGDSGAVITGITTDSHGEGMTFATTRDPYLAIRSDDGGASWIELSLPGAMEVDRLYPDPRSAGVVYASSYAGLMKSRDWGDTWVGFSNGLETPHSCRPWHCGEYWRVVDISFDLADPTVMYASSPIGMFRRTGTSRRWELAREGMLVCCRADDSWSEECDDLAKNLSSQPVFCGGGPHSVVVDPEDSEILYAATVFGTYRSGDRGSSWRLADRNSEEAPPLTLAILESGVLLGTSWRSGVVRLDIVDPASPRGGGARVGDAP